MQDNPLPTDDQCEMTLILVADGWIVGFYSKLQQHTMATRSSANEPEVRVPVENNRPTNYLYDNFIIDLYR